MKRTLTTFTFIVFITSILKGQICEYNKFSDAPKEHVAGRLNIIDSRKGHPYTLFVKEDNFNLNDKLFEIRNGLIKNLIINKKFSLNSYADLYKGIWVAANDAQPGLCPWDEACLHPAWVKNNAIIYLIGLKYSVSTTTLNDTLIPMDAGDESTVGTIKYYGGRASKGLGDLNPKVIQCPFGNCGTIRTKAFDLIQYIEGYDILRAGGYIPDWQDKEELACIPRMKLRQFTRNFYKQAKGVFDSNLGWKKNHGIICASALAMAAFVLNDAGELPVSSLNSTWDWLFNGAPWPHPDYSPINWEHDGYYGVNDNFFNGSHPFTHDVPQTNSDGTAGYAEGPGYFTDMAQALFPYVRTVDNCKSKIALTNWLNVPEFKNILNWYQSTLNHDGSICTYDNSESTWGNLLGILGQPNEFPGDAKFVASLAQHQKMDLRGDYILAMGGGTQEFEKNYYNENSGNIILRNNTKSSVQTFHMLCEKDYAVDKSASVLDGTHEDDDMGAWSLYVQDWDAFNKQPTGLSYELGVDPPYEEWIHVDATNRYWMHNTIEIDDGEPAKTRAYTEPHYTMLNDLVINSSNSIQSYDLSFAYSNTVRTANYAPEGMKRNVNMVKTDDDVYYFFNDFIDVSHIGLSVQYRKLNINGNGNANINEGGSHLDSMTYRKSGNLSILQPGVTKTIFQ